MARKLRLEYPGAIYHVINRGNYRRDVFETVGAAHSFVQTLEEAVEPKGSRRAEGVVEPKGSGLQYSNF